MDWRCLFVFPLGRGKIPLGGSFWKWSHFLCFLVFPHFFLERSYLPQKTNIYRIYQKNMDHQIEDVLKKIFPNWKSGGFSWIFQISPPCQQQQRGRACRATGGAKRRGAKLAVNDGFWLSQKLPFRIHGTGMFFYHYLWDVLSMYGIFTTFFQYLVVFLWYMYEKIPVPWILWEWMLKLTFKQKSCWSWDYFLRGEHSKPHDAIVF